MGGDIERVGVRMKRSRRGHWGWALLLLLVGLIGFLSYRPVMRLKAELPPGFAEVRKEWNAERRAAEEGTARAYWQLALNVVQSQHAYGTKLPENPFPEFKLDEREFPEGSSEVIAGVAVRVAVGVVLGSGVGGMLGVGVWLSVAVSVGVGGALFVNVREGVGVLVAVGDPVAV